VWVRAGYDVAIELHSLSHPTPSPSTHTRTPLCGRCTWSSGRFDLAIADYSRAIELDPSDPNYFNNRWVGGC
jgi:hypothetical protein